MGRVNLDDLQSEKHYGAFRAYGNAKLMSVMFTYELARRLERTGITANTLHPGFVATNFGRDSGRVSRFFLRLARPLQKTPQEGAATSVYLASSPEVDGLSGKYFRDSRPANSSRASYDVHTQKQLWSATEKALADLGVELAGSLSISS
jgi:NAD(P)-dependent dehydrogenase (short-subunit alcohol dehydrogenase family)